MFVTRQYRGSPGRRGLTSLAALAASRAATVVLTAVAAHKTCSPFIPRPGWRRAGTQTRPPLSPSRLHAGAGDSLAVAPATSCSPSRAARAPERDASAHRPDQGAPQAGAFVQGGACQLSRVMAGRAAGATAPPPWGGRGRGSKLGH